MTDKEAAEKISEDIHNLFHTWTELHGMTLQQIAGCLTGTALALAKFADVPKSNITALVEVAYK